MSPIFDCLRGRWACCFLEESSRSRVQQD